MKENRPIRVLIVGGGTAGWMTAAGLSRLLPPKAIDIELVESAEIGTVGVGEATVPHIRFFNQKLGFDEAQFMAQTQATFKLGIEFCNWGRIGDRYIHPFGVFGEDTHGTQFHHLWVRAKQAGLGGSLHDFSVPIIAAQQNRFAPPLEDQTSDLSTYSYAYQFDAGLYSKVLRQCAEGRGVRRTEGKVIDLEQDPNDGHIRSVRLESGQRLSADLFVDCSGFRALLISKVGGQEYQQWSDWLLCDRAWAAPCASQHELSPYTRSTALEAGWCWRIPLQHRIGNGHVYSSDFIDDDRALQRLLEQMESEPTTEPRQLRFTTGKRRLQWSKNVVAIGLSSGFLEPLESTSIHLIQLAIGYLIDLFPSAGNDPKLAAEFNRTMGLEYERIRDFLILHYHATQRNDGEFWNYCRNMQIPDSLAYRMALFEHRGLVAQSRQGMFLDASWLAVYFGQNLIPKHYDPMADGLPTAQLRQQLAALQQRYQQRAAQLPLHQQYLDQIGAAAITSGTLN